MKPSKNERLQWQAEEDASTMARYQEIMNDSARRNRAVKVAQKQAEDLTRRANLLKNVNSVSTRKTKK